MKVILVITNSKRKSLVFISDALNACSLQEAVQATGMGKIEGAHIVHSEKGSYIRTNPGVPKSNEFDTLSITIGNLLLYAQGIHATALTPALKTFITIYSAHLEKDDQLIKPIGQPEVLAKSVKEKLQQHKQLIFDAAKTFDIDPYLLSAILIDEIARLIPFEEIADMLGAQIIGRNTSVGIAQVKTDTANSIIRLGLYNPNPKDPKLPFKELNRAARAHLYTYLIEPKHGIFFAAAIIKDIFNAWQPIAGNKLTPAVVFTLYSKGGKPHPNPDSNDRGKQIQDEFYKLAKEILR